jgi:hypothetical protein
LSSSWLYEHGPRIILVAVLLSLAKIAPKLRIGKGNGVKVLIHHKSMAEREAITSIPYSDKETIIRVSFFKIPN